MQKRKENLLQIVSTFTLQPLIPTGYNDISAQ